ncbi:hypothetical protein C5167_021946 [Papaver somniferum]|uniref:Uncharacterized protein n=1 Tax=Papaver somniferum TaxID=3469 RepID=A0A4Y7JGV3_PAPSO|nr:hypothetical protein C5167_007078 [Papaver somniferum]RZC60189.1 hypothetical protein C5167_021946 [Papaver somniferum]
MDSNRKRRGFIKGRIILSLYRTSPKPTTASTFQFSSKVKPTNISSEKEFVVPQASSNKKVAFLTTDNIVRDSYVGAGDNNVDMKASNYISYVQERFKLERVDSERRKYQDTLK